MLHTQGKEYLVEDITDFVKENSIDDVIFMNNISATRNQSLVNKLSEKV